MSDTTAELALKMAVDADDTADYLTIDLRNSLNTVDGLFNSSTGHNHNGAHQGGNLVFSVLNTTSIAFANGATLGPFSTGNQLRFQSTNVSFSGNATIDGTLTAVNATISGTLTPTTVAGNPNFTGAPTIASLTVTGALTTGPITTGSAINANSLFTTLDVQVGRDLTVTRNASITGTGLISGNLGVGTAPSQVRAEINGLARVGSATSPQPGTVGFGIEIFAPADAGLGTIQVVTRSGGAVASRSPLLLPGDVTIGSGAPAVGATTGFPRLPSMAGPPTGAPDQTGVLSGHRSIVIEDSGSPRIWVRVGAGWRSAALT